MSKIQLSTDAPLRQNEHIFLLKDIKVISGIDINDVLIARIARDISDIITQTESLKGGVSNKILNNFKSVVYDILYEEKGSHVVDQLLFAIGLAKCAIAMNPQLDHENEEDELPLVDFSYENEEEDEDELPLVDFSYENEEDDHKLDVFSYENEEEDEDELPLVDFSDRYQGLRY